MRLSVTDCDVHRGSYVQLHSKDSHRRSDAKSFNYNKYLPEMLSYRSCLHRLILNFRTCVQNIRYQRARMI